MSLILLLEHPLAWFVAHGIAVVAAFSAATAIISLVRLNKGAKTNTAWGFLAAGALLLGIGELAAAIAAATFGLAPAWTAYTQAAAGLAWCIGALLWRKQIASLLK